MATAEFSKFVGILRQWSQDWKKSVFTPVPKKDNVKECSNYHTIALISYASKVMLKIFEARLNFRKGLKILFSVCEPRTSRYPADVGSLISGSSAFSKSSLNIWKFVVHILLKPGLENFEHYFGSM